MGGRGGGNVRVTITGDESGLDRSTGRAERRLSKFQKSALAVGAVVATGLAAGIGAGAKATIDFDKSMRNVNSIAQLNEKQFESLSGKVLKLAGPTAQAPKTLAEGMYDLVSSGFSADESLHIVEKSAKAASAGLTTAEISTKAVASVLNAYQLPARKAGLVSDQLFRTVDRGVISFEDLASNVGDVLPFASSLGVGLDQVGASIATMTKAGISAPETMTRIKNVMVTMLKPGEHLKKAFKELGVTSGEQLLKTKGFQGGLEALIGTTDGSKKAIAKLFPEIRAMGGVLALTGKNAAGARKDLDGMRKSAGATDKALSQQSKSISFAWDKLKAQVSAVAIQVGSVAVPAIASALGAVVPVVGDVARTFVDVGQAVHGSTAAWTVLGGVLGAVTGRLVALGAAWAVGKMMAAVSAVQSLISTYGVLRAVYIAQTGATNASTAAVLRYIVATKLATGASRGMAVAMSSTGIGALVVLVGTVAGALMGMKHNTDDATVSQQQFRDAVLGVRNALDGYSDVAGNVKDAQLQAKSSALALKEAEQQLAQTRKSGNPDEIKRAELTVAQAKRQAAKDVKALNRAERDASAERRKNLADARGDLGTLKKRSDQSRENAKNLRAEREEIKKINVIKLGRDADGYLAEQKKKLAANTRELAAAERRARADTLAMLREQLRLAKATGASKDRIKELKDEIRKVKSKKVQVDVDVKTKLDTDDLKFQFKGAIDGVMAGIPFQIDRSKGGKKKRRGGLVNFAAGGMAHAAVAAALVPAMLSPGELGILPDGNTFQVPGASIAADTVPMALPSGTAILTGDGQQRWAAGESLANVIANQAPHFRTGGVAGGINNTAIAARTAGFRGSHLVNMVAIAGRESGFDPTKMNLKYPDHSIGLWQINQLAHKGKYGTDAQLKHPLVNAKAAKSLFGQDGYGPWVGVHYGNAASFLDEAKRAVAATRGQGMKGSAFTKTTQPEISYPLMGDMLAPLVDDALLGGIQAGMEGRSRRHLLREVREGIVPEAEDRPTRERVDVAGARGRGGKFRPGGGWAGTKNLVMQAIAGTGGSKTYKRSTAVNNNQNSDHNTWIKNAYAADISPGSDGMFSKISRRLGISATKGSWNNFSNAPVPGYRSQLLWHAPDGSHKDHVHLGIRKMRAGGVVGMAAKKKAAKKKVRRRADSWEWMQTRDASGDVTRNLAPVLRALGGTPGTGRADRITRTLASELPGRAMNDLVRAQRQIRKRIRSMAGKKSPGGKGFTGSERIVARRLRGALSLVQDEMGRPIGRELGTTDRVQERISRAESRLPDEMVLDDVDADSVEGLQTQRGQKASALGALTARRKKLGQALRRAKRTGNKQAVAQVQAEINEVDDQVLGLKASIKGLDESIQQANKDLPKNWADAELALAGLTETLDDDRAALSKLEDLAEGDLAEAIASNDPLRIAAAAGDLKGIRDNLASLDETMQQSNELARQRQEFEKERLELDKRMVALAEKQGPAFLASFAAWIDGAIGGPVQRRSQLPFSPGVNAGYQ